MVDWVVYTVTNQMPTQGVPFHILHIIILVVRYSWRFILIIAKYSKSDIVNSSVLPGVEFRY
jgi:hypothetical protein